MNINAEDFCFEIQGHRGARGTHPENTLPAFKHAIEAGVNAIELDLVVTRDKIIVIQHNFFVNEKLCRKKDGSPINLSAPQLISALSCCQIKELDCGAKKNKNYPAQICIPGTEIPTLSELFAMIETMEHPNARKVILNLEIKIDPLHPDWTLPRSEFVGLLLSNVQAYQFTNRVYYSSFDRDVLREIRKQDTKSRIGYIFDKVSIESYIAQDQASLDALAPMKWIEFIQKICAETGAEIVSPDYTLLTPTFVKALNELELKIIPWTVNTPEDQLQLQEMGVTGIITDFPMKLIESTSKVALIN